MIIQHNLNAARANNRLKRNVIGAKKSSEKLSSGFRINRSADDAAGLAVSEKMRSQIRGLSQAIRNANDGISLIQTAEGALEETHAIIKRLKELTIQAANGTYSNTERVYIQMEINQLLTEIDRIAEATDFNGIRLLNGAWRGTQTGDNTGNGNGILEDGVAIGDPILIPHFFQSTQTNWWGGNFSSMKIAGGDSRAVAYFDFTATPSTYSAAAFFWSFTIQNIEPGTGVSLVFDAPNGEKISMTINDSLGVTDSGGIQGVFIAGLGTVWTHNVTDIHGRHGLEISIEPARDIIGNISGERDISYNGRWFISVDNSNADITADIDFAMYGLFSTSEGFFAAGFIEYETYSSDGGSNNGQNQTPDYHNRGLVLQIGDRNSVMQRVYVQLPDMTSAAIGLADISVLTVESALDSINKIDVANRAVSRERAYFGAMQNRLEHTANSLTTTTENLTSSESQIRDTDMAAEMLKYTKYNILQQAAQALLAQANQSPQGILQLLK